MIAVIPGITDTLAYLQPSLEKPRGGVFAQVLAEAARQTPSGTSETAAPPARYVVQAGDNLSRIARKLGYPDPEALARANGLKNPDLLKVGQVLKLPENFQPLENKSKFMAAPVRPLRSGGNQISHRGRRLVVASWYGSQHHGRLMANGQPFNMYAETAAHPSLPLGTRLTLTNPQTGSTATVLVTDRGPFVPGRDLDLSFEAARKLGVLRNGVAKLYMEGG
jgi:rare lipoprotein A|uniref:Probable endolytic peptidoglycan transglycosylase RlpA n=1 Tax=Desulfobacca acetoxidans TaxID=60893 RepID=A0A7C5AMR8_9BACT